jgi:hypothetical protein
MREDKTMKRIAILTVLAILAVTSLFSATSWWSTETTASPTTQETKTFQAGWANIPWIGPTMPIDQVMGSTLPNVAAVYYLDNSSGGWLRYFPGSPAISSLTTLTFGEAYLALLTEPITVPWMSEDLIYSLLPSLCLLATGYPEIDAVCDLVDDLVGAMAPTTTPTPTSAAPIVFRGTVVGAPAEECPYLELEGDCWWTVDVLIDVVVKMEQPDADMYQYEEQERVTVILPEGGTFGPAVSVGDYVEVSGQESMWSCGYLCDAWGLTVWPELFEDNYIQRL